MNRKKTRSKLSKALRKAFSEAIVGVAEQALSDGSVWEQIDEMIEKDLKQSTCSISFDEQEAEPYIFVGVGSGNAATTFSEFEIYVEDYRSLGIRKLSKAQVEGVRSQIEGIDQLIGRLEAAKQKLKSVL